MGNLVPQRVQWYALPSVEGDLTMTEAATELGVSLNTVRRRIADGSLPAYRIKGRSRLIRIRRSDLDNLQEPVVGGGAA
jgi:excisionase family DNA binding protein